jgi:AcrR family transcriptional regulator
MADSLDAAPPGRRRRSDAQRSIAAIVEAARVVLGERSDASMEDVAVTAGVSRQTVYAHFPSRGALIAAVFDAAVAEGLAAIEDANLDAAAPRVAIERFLDISWQLLHRYPILLDPTFARIRGSDGHDPHHAVTGFLERLIRRGQRSGAFDRRLPAAWLVTATLSLGHAAAEQIAAGRLTASKAATILEESVLRLYGIDPTRSRRADQVIDKSPTSKDGLELR